MLIVPLDKEWVSVGYPWYEICYPLLCEAWGASLDGEGHETSKGQELLMGWPKIK